jgi:hypothetical protein
LVGSVVQETFLRGPIAPKESGWPAAAAAAAGAAGAATHSTAAQQQQSSRESGAHSSSMSGHPGSESGGLEDIFDNFCYMAVEEVYII